MIERSVVHCASVKYLSAGGSGSAAMSGATAAICVVDILVLCSQSGTVGICMLSNKKNNIGKE